MGNRGDPEADAPNPVSAIRESRCCDEDRREKGSAPSEVDARCGGGCCADNEGDCESKAGDSEGSYYGNEEDHIIAGEPTNKEDPRGAGRISSAFWGVFC